MFERTFFFLFVLFGFLVDAGEIIKVRFGEDAVLPCVLARSCDTPSLRVEWMLGEKDVHLYRNGRDDLSHQDGSFEGRTSVFREEMSSGNISLKLTNVTAQDAGNYTCHVNAKNFPGPSQECSVVLMLTPDTSRGIKFDVAIVAVVVVIAIVAGVLSSLFLLVKTRKIKMCAVKERDNDVRINLNNTRNDDDVDDRLYLT